MTTPHDFANEHHSSPGERAKTRATLAYHIAVADLADLVRIARDIRQKHSSVPELHVVLLQLAAQTLRSRVLTGEQAMKVLTRAAQLEENVAP